MVSPVEQQIFDCIENNESFVLDAAAGSGKTWTLVQSLNYLISSKSKSIEKQNQQIACITYTNVAKDEIIERTEHNELIRVSTIHDFLWDCIKNYQKELRTILLDYVNYKCEAEKEKLAECSERAIRAREKHEVKIAKYEEASKNLNSNIISISYENFPRHKEGKISHDDLIVIAEKVFSTYPKIIKIITDSYPYIFVDEYQDTQKETVEILLRYLLGTENFMVGFFGDKIQQIYDKGIGEIPDEYNLRLIPKGENYRSSKEVIELLNKLRTDIEQYQPPQNNRTGNICFFNISTPTDFNAKQFTLNHLISRWHINSVEDIKVLYLTHRFIARENDYYDIFEHYRTYRKRDCIIDNKNNRSFCPFADYLYDLEELVDLFSKSRIQQFLKKVHFDVSSFNDKKRLNDLMTELLEIRQTKKISEVIDYAINRGLLCESDRMKNYDYEDAEKKDFFDELIEIEYAQFLRLYQVQQNNTPFSTKHNTKGDEFDNVLVVIDDDAWRQSYNFNEYFSGDTDHINRLKKTTNLFYVVCSRAKYNLAVVCVSALSSEAKLQIQEWFGEENYIEI